MQRYNTMHMWSRGVRDRAMRRYHSSMSSKGVQRAYERLASLAYRSYSRNRDAVQFLVDVQDLTVHAFALSVQGVLHEVNGTQGLEWWARYLTMRRRAARRGPDVAEQFEIFIDAVLWETE